MIANSVFIALAVAIFLILAIAAFTYYVVATYGSHIYRIFETKPLFLAASGTPQPDAEPVTLTVGSRRLMGSYLRHTAPGPRQGVVLFCHEFSANRWLSDAYVGYLRKDGFDLFTFDFCNHGESEAVPGYEPLQWVTEHELADVQAAIAYLKSRPDADPKGIGLFGVSKGGGAGIAAAAADPYVRAVITDGAFPTHFTVTHYEMRWVEIYVHIDYIYRILPQAFYDLLTECVLWNMHRRHRVRYLRLERSIRRLNDRPLLMIHGEKDNYINLRIVERFFGLTGRPTDDLWIVPKAKHNRSLEKAGDAYRDRVRAFYLRHLAGRGADAAGPVADPATAAPLAVTAVASQTSLEPSGVAKSVLGNGESLSTGDASKTNGQGEAADRRERPLDIEAAPPSNGLPPPRHAALTERSQV